MTNQELRIAVAEADGYTDKSKYQQAEEHWYYLKDSGWVTVPNYPEDLTAIHAAVNRKNENFRFIFNEKLHDKTYVDTNNNKHICELTAKDWCEVFVEVANSLSKNE